MTERQPDRLSEAQQHRAMVRADFFELLVRSMVQVRERPDSIEEIVALIRAESDRVSASLTATDLALIDRVAGIVGIEQAIRAEQIAELREDLPHRGEP